MNATTPRLQFDPVLMEAVVTRALTARIAAPAGFNPAAFHAEADPIYACKNPDQRAAQFRDLFARWFCRGQFDRPFGVALAELPDVADAVSLLSVTGAASRADERADLASAAGTLIPGERGRFWIGVSVQPARLLDRPALAGWLRHELWHIRDMLDPAFGYAREDLARGPAERLPQRVVQDRYALLWSLSVDARIERAGFTPLYSKTERLARVAAALPGFSTEQHETILESIGATLGLRHPDLVDFARSPRRLAGSSPSAECGTPQPVRGSACPLCHFPTFHWADLAGAGTRSVVEAIRQAYPAWAPQAGVCSTCFDLFSIRSGVWV